MFPNIPNTNWIHVVDKKLINCSVNTRTIEDIAELLRFACLKTVFLFNKNFHRQKVGLAISSPLSPLLTKIFMSNFEEIFSKTKSDHILFWHNYIDDILVCFTEKHICKTHSLQQN